MYIIGINRNGSGLFLRKSLEKREFEYFLLEFHFMNFIQMIKFNLERFLSPNFQLHFPKGTIRDFSLPSLRQVYAKFPYLHQGNKISIPRVSMCLCVLGCVCLLDY